MQNHSTLMDRCRSPLEESLPKFHLLHPLRVTDKREESRPEWRGKWTWVGVSCATRGADHKTIIFSTPLQPTAPTLPATHQGTGEDELFAEKKQEGVVREPGDTGSGFGVSGTGCTITQHFQTPTPAQHHHLVHPQPVMHGSPLSLHPPLVPVSSVLPPQAPTRPPPDPSSLSPHHCRIVHPVPLTPKVEPLSPGSLTAPSCFFSTNNSSSPVPWWLAGSVSAVGCSGAEKDSSMVGTSRGTGSPTHVHLPLHSGRLSSNLSNFTSLCSARRGASPLSTASVARSPRQRVWTAHAYRWSHIITLAANGRILRAHPQTETK